MYNSNLDTGSSHHCWPLSWDIIYEAIAIRDLILGGAPGGVKRNNLLPLLPTPSSNKGAHRARGKGRCIPDGLRFSRRYGPEMKVFPKRSRHAFLSFWARGFPERMTPARGNVGTQIQWVKNGEWTPRPDCSPSRLRSQESERKGAVLRSGASFSRRNLTSHDPLCWPKRQSFWRCEFVSQEESHCFNTFHPLLNS